MFDGDQYLATRFKLARQLITDEQVSTVERVLAGVFKVLQIVDAAFFSEFEQLPKPDGEETSGIQLARIAANALSVEQLIEATQEYSLIHYIGPIGSPESNELH